MPDLSRDTKITLGAALTCVLTVASAGGAIAMAWHDFTVESVTTRADNEKQHESLRVEIQGLKDAVEDASLDRIHRGTMVQWRALFQAQNPGTPIPEIP